MDTFNGVTTSAQPWEAAISPDGKRIYALPAPTI